jgi:hypothetical protein
MRTALAIVLFLTGSVLAQNTIGYSRTLKRYDKDQTGKISVMPTSLYTNCVLWQTFSRNDGTNYYDVANTNNAVGSAAGMWSNLVGGATVYEGSRFASFPASLAQNRSNLTLAVWLRARTSAAYLGVYSEPVQTGDTLGRSRLLLALQSDWKIEFGGRVSAEEPTGALTGQRTTGAITSNQWAHVTGVWNTAANTISVYFNGTQQATTAIGAGTPGAFATNAPNSAYPQRLGSRSGINYFVGDIGDVQIFNRALTSNEVVNLYNSTKGTYGY